MRCGSMGGMTKDEQVTIRMEPELAKRARAQASKEDRTLANLIRRALARYLEDEGQDRA